MQISTYNFTDSLVSGLDSEIFLRDTADLIVAFNGELDYEMLTNIFNNKLPYDQTLMGLLFAGLIAYHIPINSNGTLRARPIQDSIRAAQTFWYTRLDENAFIEYSKTTKLIPELKRHDPKDNGKFKSGPGERLADFEAINDASLIYEMKAGDSPSSYHDATNLIIKDKNLRKYVGYRLINSVIIPASQVVYEGFISIYRDYN